MIYILQGGRCGNQLFNYAFAREIQKIYPEQEICVCTLSLEKKQGIYGESWEDSLKHFAVKPYRTWIGKSIPIKDKGSIVQKIIWNAFELETKLARRKIWPFSKQSFKKNIFEKASKYGVYYNTFFGVAPYKVKRHKDYFIYGGYEDKNWFEDLRQTLYNEFKPIKCELPNVELMRYIQDSNSICVSLRNWEIDVADKSNINNRNICDASYYKRSIEYIKDNVKKPVFIVFSDDVEWGKKIVQSVAGDCEVIAESGLSNVAEKLYYMSMCKNFILANSTFSWWAQYLSQNNNKIVISPSKWFKNKEDHPLIDQDWILL